MVLIFYVEETKKGAAYMFRRLLLTLIVLVTVPAVANAWYVTGKNMSPAGYGTIDPSGMKSISGTSGTSYIAKAKPNAGYAVSQVLIDNAKQAIPAPDGTGSYNFTITYNGVFYRNFTVTFA